MPVSALTCPACGAPAPHASGSCAYCGATLQVAGPAPSVANGPAAAGHPAAGVARLDVILHGLGAAQVPILVEVLGRPHAVMAEVPTRQPPAVFGVPSHLVAVLQSRLGPGVRLETRPSQGPPRGPGGMGGGGRPGFGGRPGPGHFRGPGRR
ncbi:MAG: hypothetical protein FJ090_07270 [Deltaproteobacteria bacterium]|nr:hypothetical protein [Deltaproteobacteria bacterium]